MPAHIFTGSVQDVRPLINMEITISSNEMIKAKRAPEIILGLIRGKVILKNV